MKPHGKQLDEGYPLPEWSVEQHLMAIYAIDSLGANGVKLAPHVDDIFGKNFIKLLRNE